VCRARGWLLQQHLTHVRVQLAAGQHTHDTVSDSSSRVLGQTCGLGRIGLGTQAPLITTDHA
jgi:hypothetical protein